MLYSEVNCDNCDLAAEDGIPRPCDTDQGCWIPPLERTGRRALEIRDKLCRLHALNVGGTILSLYRATLNDLEMIAVIEDTLKEFGRDNDDQGEK